MKKQGIKPKTILTLESNFSDSFQVWVLLLDLKKKKKSTAGRGVTSQVPGSLDHVSSLLTCTFPIFQTETSLEWRLLTVVSWYCGFVMCTDRDQKTLLPMACRKLKTVLAHCGGRPRASDRSSSSAATVPSSATTLTTPRNLPVSHRSPETCRASSQSLLSHISSLRSDVFHLHCLHDC